MRILPTAKQAGPSLLIAFLALLAFSATPAFAQSSWWHLTSSTRPTYLPPAVEEEGKLVPGKGQVIVTVSNLGDASVNGGAQPVSIVDTLPTGLKAVSVKRGKGGQIACAPVPAVSCSFTGTLAPFAQIEVVVDVDVEATEPRESTSCTPEPAL
jgi:uncharacterized repeat protein (TIGR01451 family)